LADKPGVAAVELLFFMYNPEVRAEFEADLGEIIAFKKRFHYTAHLPDPVLPCHEELIARLEPHVGHFIVHGGDPGSFDGGAAVLEGFKATYGSERFVLENTTSERFNAVETRMSRDTRICLDTGHLVLEGKSPAEFFDRFHDRLAEVHLHGVDREAASRDGLLPDHRGLRGDESWFRELVPRLREFSGVINVEVFDWTEAQKTLVCLEECL
jgi:hypothetical protein